MTTPDETVSGMGALSPLHRYTARLANEIEARWQGVVAGRRNFRDGGNGPVPSGSRRGRHRDRRCTCSTCSRTRPGSGSTSGTRSATSPPTYWAVQADDGQQCFHAFGFDAFGLPAEQYAVQTGQHPRVTTEENIAGGRAQLRRLGLAHDERRSVATTDPAFYRWTQWIFLQIFNSWYDEETGRARPIDELVALLAAGKDRTHRRNPRTQGRVGPTRRAVAAQGRRLPPPGVHRRGAGELVPGARHGPCGRGGDPRGPE